MFLFDSDQFSLSKIALMWVFLDSFAFTVFVMTLVDFDKYSIWEKHACLGVFTVQK